MEKDQNIEPVDTQEDETALESTPIESSVPTNESVIVKKSGGQLALLMSLMALGCSGYLLYKDMYQSAEPVSQPVTDEVLSQLESGRQQSIQSFQSLQKQQEKLAQSIKTIETDLKVLKADQASLSSGESPVITAFDNSSNEAVMAGLQSGLAEQAERLQQLQSQLDTQTNNPSVGQVLPDSFAMMQHQAALQALATAKTLAGTGQITVASSVLKNFLQGTTLERQYQGQIEQIIQQLDQVVRPDKVRLKQQLKVLEKAISQLEIPTEQTVSDEAKWYDRFVSVKKISENSAVQSSVDLLSLKFRLKQSLYRADLLLSLADQPGWQQSLNEAADLLGHHLPQQQQLIQQIKNLAQEPVVATLPMNLAWMPLMDELKELR